MNEKENNSGGFYISNSKFINNTSEYGTFLNVPFLNKNTGTGIEIHTSEFTNNTASKFGGIIYSLGEYNNYHMKLVNNQYNNNNAKLGNIIYSYSLNSLPDIVSDNINKDDIVTLPSYFEVDKNSYEDDEITILSGESIPDGITCM